MASAPKKRRREDSRAAKTQLKIRERILNGTLPPGERISELAMVAELGVSRTPVRIALVRLASEGLLEPIPSGGYAVRTFTDRDILEGVELRGTLEGLAARLAAERGVDPEKLAPINGCLEEIDALLPRLQTSTEPFPEYVELNARFHWLVVRLAGSELLAREVERVNALPFASPGAIVHPRLPDPEGAQSFLIAQDQHRRIVEAILAREGARAEAILREHARIASRNIARVAQSRPYLSLLADDLLIDAGADPSGASDRASARRGSADDAPT